MLEMRGDCDDCSGVLTFYSGAFARDRTLTIRDALGGVVFRGIIAGTPTKIISFSRRTTLSFATDPPPDQVNEFVPGDDTRSFGVFISRVQFRPN